MNSGSRDSELKSLVYPQFEPISFLSFLQKTGKGIILSFIPAFVYNLISEVNIFTVWGITLLITSGLYFIIGGCSDLSQSSARKSFKQYQERAKRTGHIEGGFKYDIGLVQFGKNWENIAAAICLFSISILVTGFGR